MKWGAGDVMWSIDWGSLCDCTLWTGVIERTNWKDTKDGHWSPVYRETQDVIFLRIGSLQM